MLIRLPMTMRSLVSVSNSWAEAPNYSLLSHCRELQRLTFYHDAVTDYSFLRSLPQLKYLADYCDQGIRIEDATMISREAPNLQSITFNLSALNSVTHYELLGRELCCVENLMLWGDKRSFVTFLDLFLSNHSLFPRVITLRLLGDPFDFKDMNLSNEFRPQCSISTFTYESSKQEQCDICWGIMDANWICPRCKCFTFVLR